MQPQSPLAARLTAEMQCDWVDRTLGAVQSYLTTSQTDLLVRASTGQHMRRGIALAAVPRGAAAGLTCGRYPTTMVRDVVVALAHVLVDDQIVAPLVRMGRRLPAHDRAPPKLGARGAHKAPGYEKAAILVWSTGKAVLAAPLNALVIGLGAAGATVGAMLGALVGVALAVAAPEAYVKVLGRNFAVLYHCIALEQRATPAPQEDGTQGADAHEHALAALKKPEEMDLAARAAAQALAGHPGLSRAAGLGPWVGVDAAALMARSHARADAAARQQAHAEAAAPAADPLPSAPPPPHAIWPLASPLSPILSEGSDLGDYDD